jgi:phosphoribosyl 1,2-cyclic phosphodiesterase
MIVRVWGCRGSIASPGPETVRHGGNTACVSVETDDAIAILDAGTGLRHAGLRFVADQRPVHLLVTHLHMDHILGLGFFRPLFQPGRRIRIWGPPSTTQDLRARLTRYMSPPLFPVRIRDLASRVELTDAPADAWSIDGLRLRAASVIHPGPTLGYRLESGGSTLAYIPDHEPALGGIDSPRWTSGFDLAKDADLLIHDAQYTADEYSSRIGWGHSSIEHASAFADLARVDRFLLFHHDPDHDDETVAALAMAASEVRTQGTAEAAREGMDLEL